MVNGSYRQFCDVIIDKLESRTVLVVLSQDLYHHMLEFQAVLEFAKAIVGCGQPKLQGMVG